MNNKTGGPAFPLKEPMTRDNQGMNLRDYFAAQVISFCLGQREDGTPFDIANKISVQAAYDIADTMLAWREK